MPMDFERPVTADDEAELVRDLSDPHNYPSGFEGPVDVATTHGSIVFLGRREVYKIKRSRDYGFFDYSTAPKRRHFCEEELRLNRRTAPDVYLDVATVFRDDRGFNLAGRGAPADSAVHMRRLDDGRSALGLLRAGRLGWAELSSIARCVADFYRRVPVHPGSADTMGKNLEENFAQLASFAGPLLDGDLVRRVRERQGRWFERNKTGLAARPAKDGHGDLRLEHVYLLDDGPVLIDCIEFVARFRIADPALDAAFLAMDLHGQGRPELAEIFLARFAFESDDYDLYRLVDGYTSYRAVVRAKVACFVAADARTPPAVVARKRAEAMAWMRLAHEFFFPSPDARFVIAVGGPIASGKSRVAEFLAAHTGAVVINADATRKSLFGLAHEDRGGSALYTPAATEAVQAELLRRAAAVLDSGRSVILDTTFQRRALRDRVRAMAAHHAATFRFIECRAPVEELRRRLRARRGGVSDAREELLPSFLAGYETPDEVPDAERSLLDTTLPLEISRFPAFPRLWPFRPADRPDSSG